MNSQNKLKICYFGIYNPDFGRNKIYIEALRKAGHDVIECRDSSSGFGKYINLWKKHAEIKGSYDVMIVGYPAHTITFLAKILSSKKVIIDALGSIYDAEINSHIPTALGRFKAFVADRIMVMLADKIMVESEEQKKFFEEKFGVSEKYEVVYTGACEKFSNVFNASRSKIPSDYSRGKKITVVFRGRLTPECGIMHILGAAKILKGNRDISWRIVGFGYLLEATTNFIKENELTNVEMLSGFVAEGDLVKYIQDADIMLGQFDNNPRLDRTIPHKAYEAFAMGIPYLSGDAKAIREVVEDNVSCFLVPIADPIALANKVEYLSKHKSEMDLVSITARKMFEEKFTGGALVDRLIHIMLK